MTKGAVVPCAQLQGGTVHIGLDGENLDPGRTEFSEAVAGRGSGVDRQRRPRETHLVTALRRISPVESVHGKPRARAPTALFGSETLLKMPVAFWNCAKT